MAENIVAEGFGRGYAYSFRLSRMFAKLKKAGGVAYEVLQHSGLLELRQQKILWNNFEENLRAHDIDGIHYGVALEVYVELEEKETPDRIYLCAGDLGRYRILLELGTIREGRLVIKYETLPKIAELGFHCIYTFGEEEKGATYARYAKVFYSDMKHFEIKPWRTQKISESGFNLVLLNPVNATERIETKVDLYALETAMHVLEQENQIREYIDPLFYVEQIEFGPWDDEGIPFDFWDDEVLELLKQETEGVFLREAGLKLEDFPLCYRKLAYQTAYIKYYYPQLDEVMKEVEKAYDREVDALGIELDYDVSRGAYCCSDREVRLVRRRQEIVDYNGCQSNYDAGVVVSEMGLVIQQIKKRAALFMGDDVNHITVCLPTQVLDKDRVTRSMERIRRKGDRDAEQELSLQIYEELELTDCGTVDFVKKAAELAGVEKISIVPRALSIVSAYEHMNQNYRLVGWENGLVLDWNYSYLCISVVSRLQDTDVNILNQRIIRLPMGSLDQKKELNHAFLDELHNSMYEELNKDGMLQYLEMDSNKEMVWNTFYRSAGSLIKQMMRCNYGYLIFDEEGSCPKVEKYPASAFEKLFAPYCEKAEEEIRKVLWGVQYSFDDISKVYFAGEWGNYPYLWNRMKALFEGNVELCVMADTTYAAVKGAAFLAKDAGEIQ